MMFLVKVVAPFLYLLATTSAFVILPDAFKSSKSQQIQSLPKPSPLPVVIWHGLGDNFENPGLQDVAELINETNPDTVVHIIGLADTGASDRTATFFGNVTEQVAQVCEQLAKEPKLRNAPAINAIGFSQGGQFLRGYVERCNDPPVYNLVTFGSQHNGISEFEGCSGPTDWTCHTANALLRWGQWTDYVQSRLVPAQYFRDPEQLDQYLNHSNFLADINNERPLKNVTYAQNIARLNKFVMYLFENDTTVIPMESGWFAEVNTTSAKVTPLKERDIYKEDWLGLKILDRKGGLIFDTLKGGHMRLEEDELKETFKKYFSPVSIQDLERWEQGTYPSFTFQDEL